MKTLSTIIAQEPPFQNKFYDWLLDLRDITGGDTAVSELHAVAAWRNGSTAERYAEYLQERDKAGAE